MDVIQCLMKSEYNWVIAFLFLSMKGVHWDSPGWIGDHTYHMEGAQ